MIQKLDVPMVNISLSALPFNDKVKFEMEDM